MSYVALSPLLTDRVTGEEDALYGRRRAPV